MPKPTYTARTADKHHLYEQSVQCVEADVRFMNRVFRREFGVPPKSLREDFCGTAALCAAWVRAGEDRVAHGVDLDADVLAWGRARNVFSLGKAAERLVLKRANVLTPKKPLVDIQVAFNFSYCIFQDRKTLLRYFKAVRSSLARNGMFLLDLHGGPESQEALVETKSFPGFKYEWEQGPYNPVDARAHCYIHFRFPDGTRMRRAFSYDWRLWSIMELRDALADAGFRETHVYWEGTDRDTGEGDGVYRRTMKAENDPSYISYVMALR